MHNFTRSSVAPTVRPTPVIFYRRFIRRYTKAWVLPVIMIRRRLSLLTLTYSPPPAESVLTRTLPTSDSGQPFAYERAPTLSADPPPPPPLPHLATVSHLAHARCLHLP
jgi:hypothetical protein